MKGVVVASFRPRQSSLLWMNEANSKQIWNNKSKDANCDERGSQDDFQNSHDQLFTVLGLIVELSTAIVKPKGSLEAYFPIR